MSTPEGQIGPDISVAFVDALHGWAMRAGSPATQCQAQGVTLWASSDGARTWQTVLDLTLGSGTRAVGGINAFQCKENLAFVDTRRGFLTAWDPNGPPTIYQTTDGGTTWTGARLPDPPGFTSNGAGFTLRAGPVADFGTALYVAATGNVGGAMASYAFRSTDAGATWTYATQLPGENVVFLTPTHWIQLAPPNESKETTDAGASWHAFATDYTQAAPIAPQVVFGDAQTGYATVRGTIQRTVDGGAHWKEIVTPGTR